MYIKPEIKTLPLSALITRRILGVQAHPPSQASKLKLDIKHGCEQTTEERDFALSGLKQISILNLSNLALRIHVATHMKAQRFGKRS